MNSESRIAPVPSRYNRLGAERYDHLTLPGLMRVLIVCGLLTAWLVVGREDLRAAEAGAEAARIVAAVAAHQGCGR